MRTVLLLLALSMALTGPVAAQHGGKSKHTSSKERVRLLIETGKPYDKVISRIRDLGGTVNYEFKNANGLVATLPEDKLEAFNAMPQVERVRKDKLLRLEDPAPVERAGYGPIKRRYELNRQDYAGEAAIFSEVAPKGYYPYEVSTIKASDFWAQTGHTGEGVIIGIMDSGVAEVDALAGRVIGGESFLPVDPAIDDGLPANSPLNGSHGTNVATAAGADALFGFYNTSPLVQALQQYLPSALIPDAYGPGTSGVPMVGPAPSAEFFALKIFNRDGVTSNSVILAAFDRTIELKKLADMGDPSGVDIRVVNGSFGGGTLFAAEDPFFAGMVDELTKAGIVTVFSAGNEGPSGMTGGDPGVARNTLTVGATSIAAYEKVYVDLVYGPGLGGLWRANDLHQTASFSSRGPTADGRPDPDITAPGDYIFMQGPDGGLSVASGTSFSAPIVAGAAALLISQFPNATPAQVRGALLAGANPNVLQDRSGEFDQGEGFLDVAKALKKFGTKNPKDKGLESPLVKANVMKTGVKVSSSRSDFLSTGWLLPGEREELFLDIKATDERITVTVSVTPENPAAQQNQLFGDDVFVALQSSKTATADYRAGTPAFVAGTQTFTLERGDLEEGLTRVTVMGDWTNAGRVRATVNIERDKERIHLQGPMVGLVAQDEQRTHTVDVKEGTTEMVLTLDWLNGWDRWPTTDLDLYAMDPAGNLTLIDGDGDEDFDGLSSDVPERLTIPNPAPGEWTLIVDGYAVWSKRGKWFGNREGYLLQVDVGQEEPWWASLFNRKKHLTGADTPTEYGVDQNYPNPFNPSTEIRFQLPEAAHVQLVVYDVMGREVKRLVDQPMDVGQHEVTFDAGDLPSGAYFYRINAGEYRKTMQMVLVK